MFENMEQLSEKITASMRQDILSLGSDFFYQFNKWNPFLLVH